MDTFQGNMNTILQYLQAQKVVTSTFSNPAIVMVNDVIVVITSVDTIVETMIHHVVSHSICQLGPSRHVVGYPWRLPPNFTPQVVNGNAFVPYQLFVVHPANGNSMFILGA